MALSPFNVLPQPQPEQPLMPPPLEVMLGTDEPTSEDIRVTELPDGAAIVDLNPYLNKSTPTNKFDGNLAEGMDEGELGRIASELMQGIQADEASRAEWLDTLAEGIKLLGLTVDDTRAGTTTGAPLEGMSTARHPLLLEACQLFQANARGELLPAAGPVKVRDDRPTQPPAPPMPPPPMPMMGHNGGPPLNEPSPFAAPGMAPPAMPPVPPMPGPAPLGTGAPGMAASPQPAGMQPEKISDRDITANGLEKDFNHYLTVDAPEYYPDTDRMLFNVGFSGQGVKKVYNCPIRRRPVSESIPMEDFIVSNALTDLGNATRITHKIKMRQSVMKRMQLLGVYRNIPLGMPAQGSSPNAVDQAKAEVAGVQPQVSDPKDADYELYEVYCELVLDEFAPKHFKGKELPLPYRVTIERDSQKVLEVRRNWKEKDVQCLAREYFVEFPYNKAFGFYGIGLLHILGNTEKTLTAAWRELIDSGMFANFPGFIYAKGAGRQLTNQFRIPPGGGIGLDIGLSNLRDAVMPLPYKDLGPAFTAFIQHVEELGQRVGGTANIAVSEGRADAPVGTTLALIEQATKPVGAVLKRLHMAQSKEFQLLKERFLEDPEAFWRFNKRPALPWRKEQFIKALDDFDLVPVSDPNNPTKLHRAAKASVLQQIATSAPGLLDPRKVWRRVADELEIADPDDLLMPPQPPQGDPVAAAKMAEVQAKAQGEQAKANADVLKTRIQQEGDLAELGVRKEIALIQKEIEQMKLAGSMAIQREKMDADKIAGAMKIASDHAKTVTGREHERAMANGGAVNGAGE